MVERMPADRDGWTLERVGGVAAILLGITTALVGLFYLLLPSDQRVQEPAAELLPSFAEDSTMLQLELLALAVSGILGLAAVPALSRAAGAANDGWVRWAGTVALVGFAVTAVGNFRTLNRLPGIADAFVAGDQATRAALAPVWRATLDPDAILGWGGVGVWILVLNLLALRRGGPPRGLWALGVLVGVAYLLVPIAQVLDVSALVAAAAAGGIVVATPWYVWAGTTALRSTVPARQPR